MQEPGNKSMISEQQGHLEMYLQFIHSHYPGFLWNFVNFDYFEEDFIIPDKPKFKGQTHHMFLRFLNLRFFSRNFLCFVFLLVNLVEEACAKCFEIHMLEFEILQTT